VYNILYLILLQRKNFGAVEQPLDTPDEKSVPSSWYTAIPNDVQIHQKSGERRAYPMESMKFLSGRITVNIPMAGQRYCEILFM
jgi:hypothetical protein